MIPRNCNFCGLCCTLAVKVTETEIEKIESLGHPREKFTEKDFDGNTILKRPQGWCNFFERKNNMGYCKIYDARPKPCSDFPGEKLCTLSDNVMFRVSDNIPSKVKLLLDKAPKKNDPLPKEQPKFPL